MGNFFVLNTIFISMLSFFKPPVDLFADKYEQSRFNLIWNFCIALVVLMMLIIAINLWDRNYPIVPNILGAGIAAIVWIVLKITGKYKVIAAIASVSSVLVMLYTFFQIHTVIHFTTALWAVVCILYTFFALGLIWGIIILAAHFAIICVYYTTKIHYNIQHFNLDAHPSLTLDFIIECLFIGIAISYLLAQFIRSNKFAENELKLKNKALTERNKLISRQNKEKELMLKEIHHRVKNNLQVITSLLRLQSNDFKDEDQKATFREAINRIGTMALIHEQMYKSEVIVNFDLDNYLRTLTNNIIETYNVETEIQLEINSEVSDIGMKGLVPVSLIFNELISNSLKHAFRNKSKGSISVSIEPCEQEGYFKLIYKDNGDWKEPGAITFGIELIETMTEQLEGKCQKSLDESGTSFTFELKKLE